MDLFANMEADRAAKEKLKKLEQEAVTASDEVIADEAWFGFENKWGVNPPKEDGNGVSIDRFLSLFIPDTKEYEVPVEYHENYFQRVVDNFREVPAEGSILFW